VSKFSVNKPYTVVVAVIIVIVLGVISFFNMSTDLLPSFDLPYLVVVTTYPGATPEEVEQTVTKPLEQTLSTTGNVKKVDSTSNENYSTIILEFYNDVNMDSAIIEMNSKIDMLKSQWNDSVSSPTIIKLNPDAMPVMVVAVDADDMEMEEISGFTENTVMPAIESIDGVASVSAEGLYEAKIKVSIDEEKVKKVNDDIRAIIDDQLNEASEALEEAQDKLDEGQAALADQSKTRTEQLEKATIEITNGKIVLAQTEGQLTSAESQLTQIRGALASALDTANQQLAGLEAKKAELEKRIAEGSVAPVPTPTIQPLPTESPAESGEPTPADTQTPEQTEQAVPVPTEQAAVPAGDGGAAEQDTAAQEDAAARAEGMAATGEGGAGAVPLAAIAQEQPEPQPTAQPPAVQSEDEIELAVVNESIKQLESMKSQLESGLASLDAQLAQITAGKAALVEAKSQISQTELQLADGKGLLAEGLNEGTVEVASGKAVLQSKMDEFDLARESSEAQADMAGMITPAVVSQLLYAQNFSMPAGYITHDGRDYLVKVGEELQGVDELRELVLFDMGMEGMDVIRLRDVADVEEVNNADDVYATINNNDGIILTMQKQSSYSTSDVSKNINDRMEELMAEHPGLHLTILMDQGVYISVVIDNVLNNLLYGAILAIIVLFLFLRDIRPTFIVALSIPISVVFALVLMYFSGVTLNVISLAGLALGVGMLVDNSIVVIENIFRLRSQGESAKNAAIAGAKQVSGAIIASTLTTVCVFLPIVFVQGISRQLFMDMGLTIAYSLLASLIVALTLVPSMSSRMLAGKKFDKEKKELKVFEKFKQFYARALGWSLRFKPVILVPVFALFGFCLYSVFSMGVTFLPSMDSTQITMTMEMPVEHSTFEETAGMADKVIERVLEVQDVETVGAMEGGMNMLGGGASGSATFYVMLDEDRKITSEQAADEIRKATADLDCELSVSASAMDFSALSGEGIQVNIKGNDLDVMQGIAQDVAGMLEETEGTMEVSDGLEDSVPEIRVIVDREKAMEHNLTVAQVYTAVSGIVSEGAAATELEVESYEYPVVVVDGAREDVTPEDLLDMTIQTEDLQGNKGSVRLGDIVRTEEAQGLTSINRSSQVRYITASALVDSQHNVGLVSRDFSSKLAGYDVPDGYTVEVEGENATIMDALDDLIYMLLLAIGLIYLIMVAQFQSLLSPFIVMFTIPLAFTGGLLALMLTGFDISVIAMLGFLILAGIIVNNGIVLVDYINQLRREGVDKREAIIEAGKTRLRPIMMTALTTILGLLTLSLGIGDGADMLQPMAVVTIGGLVYGTFLTIFIAPLLYDVFNKKPMKKPEAEDGWEMLEDGKKAIGEKEDGMG